MEVASFTEISAEETLPPDKILGQAASSIAWLDVYNYTGSATTGRAFTQQLCEPSLA